MLFLLLFWISSDYLFFLEITFSEAVGFNPPLLPVPKLFLSKEDGLGDIGIKLEVENILSSSFLNCPLDYILTICFYPYIKL